MSPSLHRTPLGWNSFGNHRDFRRTRVGHVLVIVGIVADVAREPSSFSKPPTRCINPGVPGIAQGRARYSSRAYGMNGSSDRSLRMLHFDRAILLISGIRHGSAAVGDVAVREQSSPGTCTRSQFARLRSRRIRSNRRATRGDHGNGDSPLRPNIALQQIALLCLGRQSGARPAALDVDDDHRQFQHHAQSHPFAFQCDAGAAAGGDAHRPPNAAPIEAHTAAISSSA